MQLTEETVGKKVLRDGKVYRCISFGRAPSAQFINDETKEQFGCSVGSPLADELKPFEETLSDKIFKIPENRVVPLMDNVVMVEDVKEFIERLKNHIHCWLDEKNRVKGLHVIDEIDKLLGERFK